MLSGSLPYMQTYPLVSLVWFTASPQGWRTQDELAEFLGLSPLGLRSYQRWGGRRRLYGPRYASKTTPAVPAGGYSDEAVAEWILRRSKTEMSWLGYLQHTHPSEANKSEAKASTDSMLAAERLLKR